MCRIHCITSKLRTYPQNTDINQWANLIYLSAGCASTYSASNWLGNDVTTSDNWIIATVDTWNNRITLTGHYEDIYLKHCVPVYLLLLRQLENIFRFQIPTVFVDKHDRLIFSRFKRVIFNVFLSRIPRYILDIFSLQLCTPKVVGA